MRLLAALAFGALLAGATAGLAYELPEPEIASRADMPRDAVLVLDALVEALRGSGRAVDRVRFAAGVGGDLAEADFRYEGFTYDEAALYRLDEGRNQSRPRRFLGCGRPPRFGVGNRGLCAPRRRSRNNQGGGDAVVLGGPGLQPVHRSRFRR